MNTIVVLLALSLSNLFAQARAEEDPRAVAEKADSIREQVYRRPEVRRYCMSNPTSYYPVEFEVDTNETITIFVRCSQWHDWEESHRK